MTQLVAIAGPTAAGKSALAIALARRFGGEVLNADSQQVYRGLDIGTGKPAASERAEVPHHLFDVVEPWEQFTAARFVESAEQIIARASARQRPLFVVGGTGLWLRALLKGLVDAPASDPAVRSRLEAEADAVGLAELLRRLGEVDPISAASIQGPNRVRIIRALEVYELAGVPLSRLHEEHRAQPPRHTALQLGLDLPRELLDERINRRARVMFESGLLDETSRALKVDRSRRRLELVMGYREALLHLEGRLSVAKAIELTATAQRQYARRQRTWFRSEPWYWLSCEAPVEEAEALCAQWLGSRAAPPRGRHVG